MDVVLIDEWDRDLSVAFGRLRATSAIGNRSIAVRIADGEPLYLDREQTAALGAFATSASQESRHVAHVLAAARRWAEANDDEIERAASELRNAVAAQVTP